jgi:hypothetical protein
MSDGHAIREKTSHKPGPLCGTMVTEHLSDQNLKGGLNNGISIPPECGGGGEGI